VEEAKLLGEDMEGGVVDLSLRGGVLRPGVCWWCLLLVGMGLGDEKLFCTIGFGEYLIWLDGDLGFGLGVENRFWLLWFFMLSKGWKLSGLLLLLFLLFDLA
jgi:hypothetical protein